MKKRSKISPDEPWPVKAYRNLSFLRSHDARSIRVLCEFEEPKARFRRMQVANTVAFFGSARMLDPKVAQEKLAAAEAKHAEDDGSRPELAQAVELARRRVEMARYYADAAELAERLTHWSMTIEKPRKQFYICSGGGGGKGHEGDKGGQRLLRCNACEEDEGRHVQGPGSPYRQIYEADARRSSHGRVQKGSVRAGRRVARLKRRLIAAVSVALHLPGT